MLFGLLRGRSCGVAVWLGARSPSRGVGLGVILAVRLALTPFSLGDHLLREWAKLANLFGLLVGFELLADHFERSSVTDRLATRLPDGAPGCFALLALVWALSGVLDNIAAALIGATIAGRLYDRRVHVGYLAALVAAANAGGAGQRHRRHDDDDDVDRRYPARRRAERLPRLGGRPRHLRRRRLGPAGQARAACPAARGGAPQDRRCRASASSLAALRRRRGHECRHQHPRGPARRRASRGSRRALGRPPRGRARAAPPTGRIAAAFGARQPVPDSRSCWRRR